VCSGPNVTNNISYSPVKERYYHGEEVEYKCSTGYGIVNSSSAIRKCVREMDLNGKVIGRWSDVPPECGVSLLPDKIKITFENRLVVYLFNKRICSK